MTKPMLFLFDATAFCYRAFYAIKGLSTSFGQPTNAIYGFVNMLNKIIKEQKPDYLAVCFDVSRETFRTKKFADYKINRPPMPEGLVAQIPLIKKIVSAYGIQILEKEGFEADDIIATAVKRAEDSGFSVTIVSSDKDILQLVGENTVVYSPYKDEGIIYDTRKVLERFGVAPSRIPEIIALMGDDVDNIPGVPGIGEKTAVGLLKNRENIEELFKDFGNIKQENLKNVLRENAGRIKLNMELALLDKNVDIKFDWDNLKSRPPDYKELFDLFKYLEFRKLLKELPMRQTQEEKIEVSNLQDKDLKDYSGSCDELYLYGESLKDLIFRLDGKFFRLEDFGKNIRDILSNPRIKKIGHDLKKTRLILNKENVSLEGIYFDTKIAAYLINPSAGPYELGDIALEYLDGAQQPALIDGERALNLIGQLKPGLMDRLCEKSLLSLFKDIEMPLVEVLSDMELNGIKLDLNIFKELSKDLETRLIKLIAAIYEISGVQFNINSPKQLREVLFEKLKLPVVKKSKTGPSTDEEVLKALSVSHKLPALLLEYRQLSKLKSTYVDALPELIDPDTGRLHTSFNQTATETGRLSSSRPNLQNLPIKTEIGSKIRQAIVADGKNSYILSGDYSQIELRILAHMSKDENLIACFKEDKDIHKITASLIFGVEEKDVTGQMRDTAKRVNFGIVYGLSAYGLSKDIGISPDDAHAFIDSYFSNYPKVKAYMQKQIECAKSQGFVTTILGRRRYLPEINNKNQAVQQLTQRQAINTPIQGSASDLIKSAMIEIHRMIKNNNLSSRMLLQVHDELVFDTPEEEVNDFAASAKDKMENVLKLDVPIKVNIKRGRNWLEA